MSDSSDTPSIKLRPRNYPVVASGLALLDEYLLGGFRKDSLLHFYGEPGSGKTTFAMQIMAQILRDGWRGIWVDCNGSFSLKRFAQILKDEAILKTLILAQPKSFLLQTQTIQQLRYYLDRVGIIVVDPITYYYRAERFAEVSQGYFQELIDDQLGTLVGIMHLQKIPVIVINYATIGQDGQRVPLVARGFQRIERYRFYFTNWDDNENAKMKTFKIEFAPEKYSQQRTFTFELNEGGISTLQLLKRTEEVKEE